MLSSSQWTSANLKQSCPGPIGPMGSIGPSGPVGVRGQNGLDGQQGSSGPSGPSGPAGASGPSGPNGLDGLGEFELNFLEFKQGPGFPDLDKTFIRNMIGKILVFKNTGTDPIGPGGITITTDNGLESGDWFMFKYSSTTPTRLNLVAIETLVGGTRYSQTTRTYVLKSSGLLGKNSVWYVYYYSNPDDITNNLYLY